MIVVKAKDVTDSYIQIMKLLEYKEEIKEVVIDVKDGGVPFVYAPPLRFDLAVELQELEDIILGEQVTNGMRFRYMSNPAQIKANGEVDWQYSHDAQPQIEAIAELLELGKLNDKGIMSFMQPGRDLHRYRMRVRAGYDDHMRQRFPCGLIWQFRGSRGGFHINITNRSVWPTQSLSSDFHIPAAVATFLGRQASSFTMFCFRMKEANRNAGANPMGRANLVSHMQKMQERQQEGIKKYKNVKPTYFHMLAASTAAARAGHFEKSHELCKKIPSGTLYRDWASYMSIAERLLQRKAIRGNIKYGVKGALQTKGLNHSQEFTVEKFYKLMCPTGVITHFALPVILADYMNRRKPKSGVRLLFKDIDFKYSRSGSFLCALPLVKKTGKKYLEIVRKKLGIKTSMMGHYYD